MLTDLLFQEDVRLKMKKGVDTLANAVKVTLGPNGRNVAIRSERTGIPHLTKDGVTVAKCINLPDKFEDMGAQLIKAAAEKTALLAGDGTTTSTLLAQVIINTGMDALKEGKNPVEIKKGIDMAVGAVVKYLKELSKKVKGDDIVSVASISANNDREIGLLVADAFGLAGENGVIHLQETKSVDTYIEKQDGIQIERGYISDYFVNNRSKMKVEFENALVIIYERKLSTFKDVENMMQYAINNKRPLLIIAEDVEGEALAVLVRNNLEGRIKVAAIKQPGFGNMQAQIIDDIACMTGGKVISAEQGHTLINIEPSYFGRANNITISATGTSIVGGGGKKEAIEKRITEVKALIENHTNEFEIDKLRKQRLAKLSNGVVVINVGAATEIEMKEKKDRIDDALRATAAAIEEGVIPGGGLTYYKASVLLSELKVGLTNLNQVLGISIIETALKAPLEQILFNAGYSVTDLDIDDDPYYGFDAKAGKMVDMLECGIIDSTKVARVALENAASVGAMFLTTECGIIDYQPIK